MTLTPVVAWSSGNTHIHKFEFGELTRRFANYVASGTVTGDGAKDQFLALDDKDGFLLRRDERKTASTVSLDGNHTSPTTPRRRRTTTASRRRIRTKLLNHLFVLGQNGPWLDATGNAGDIALNERLDSVRFVDTRGYLVTFRNVDPLFVFDSQPAEEPASSSLRSR